MKIGIIGLGLIGGSIARAATRVGHEVYGTDVDNNRVAQALENKAIQEQHPLEDLRDDCELLILCVPSRTTVELVHEALKGKALVTDVASVKSPVCDAVNVLDKNLSERFIGGHPMAGSEQSGFDASRDDMFENKMWILVPPKSNSLKHLKTIENFVFSLGAEHCILSPEQHDQLVAYISHLPQLASSTLMDLASLKSVDNDVILRLAGGGFRDMTRIAANNESMWLDIVHDNADEIKNALDAYIASLTKLRDNISNRSLENVAKLFDRSRRARQSLPDAARRLTNLTEILVPVPDKPGVLTTITSIASDINIYDIRIVHALEEDRGVLSLVVEPDVAEEFVSKLSTEGFEPTVVELNEPN